MTKHKTQNTKMKHIKICKGERVNMHERQFIIFNLKTKEYFLKTMTPIKEYDFIRILKLKRIESDKGQILKETFELVKKMDFTW